MRIGITAAASVALTLTTTPLAWSQTSEYFVMTGDQGSFHVLQGGALVRSWSVLPDTDSYQYPIVVLGNVVRTMGADVGDDGADYDLFGNDLGPRNTHPAGTSRAWDGATDGTSNYSIDTVGVIHRYGLDWTGPVALFDAGGLGSLTYDPTNDSLWVTQFSDEFVTNYTMAGVVISQFSTGHSQNMALALDQADDTLWLHNRNAQGTYEQWSKAGVMLDSVFIAAMASQNALGGEMGTAVDTCPWDCEAVPNGAVGTSDLLALLADWATPGDCDFDGGGIGTSDLLKLLASWGACP